MALRRLSLNSALAWLLSSQLVWAAAPTRTYTYTTGNTIKASEVTTNEDNIYSYLQAGVDTILDGSIVNADIAGATITYSKIQNVSATNNVLGRSSAGAGSIEEIPFSAAARDQAQETWADDQVWVADSATAGTPRTLPNCPSGSLAYTQATNTFSCAASSHVNVNAVAATCSSASCTATATCAASTTVVNAWTNRAGTDCSEVADATGWYAHGTTCANASSCSSTSSGSAACVSIICAQ